MQTESTFTSISSCVFAARKTCIFADEWKASDLNRIELINHMKLCVNALIASILLENWDGEVILLAMFMLVCGKLCSDLQIHHESDTFPINWTSLVGWSSRIAWTSCGKNWMELNAVLVNICCFHGKLWYPKVFHFSATSVCDLSIISLCGNRSCHTDFYCFFFFMG